MNRIFITLLLIFNACITHYSRENTYPSGISPKNKTIALIGFYPVRGHIVYPENKGSYYSRGLVFTTDLSHLFPYGKKIESIPANGIDSGINQENIKEFVTKLGLYKDTSKTELEKIFEIRKGNDGKEIYSLKRREVDYYVVGFFPEPIPGSKTENFLSLLKLTTMIPAAATLSTIPLWEDEFYLNTFTVYDKKLNLVKSIASDYKLNKIFSWWGERSYNLDPNYDKIYAPDGNDLGVALVSILEAFEKGQKNNPKDPLQFLTR
ncbi:hypothetical protein EHQ81_18420 [Leptospira selangorensis]|uniref:Lipoprotein n=1 Tax=Leptospira selangorensis TaxID=2484982 RepID=A0A5F2C4X1_9LEPT|nr:hypothetical protein [Leptospira selangorensis]TGM10792.1 hypothetical protein EHQ81_18420 [Leptospira selangorensis]TGM26828.1 hypothetical protein EHQ82_02140 [Leptospira selangorensis]